MPTLVAATKSRMGAAVSVPASTSFCMARPRATNDPVMEAVRVPPSAWITSQSIQMVRSPRRVRSVTARSARPISRWISWVRPPMRPRVTSRGVRVSVERGSMPYSLVIQPLPELRIQEGTASSTDAVQITRVLPTSISTEPSAVEMYSGTRFTGRIWSGVRLSERKNMLAVVSCWSLVVRRRHCGLEQQLKVNQSRIGVQWMGTQVPVANDQRLTTND